MTFLELLASSSRRYARSLSHDVPRAYTTTPRPTSRFSRPGPPPLPPKDQAEFEALIKANETIGATPAVTSTPEALEHRDLRRGPKKDFEGDVNPKTGEQGGPKTDPFKAGDGDWQYGGRVTVSTLHTGWSLTLEGLLVLLAPWEHESDALNNSDPGIF